MYFLATLNLVVAVGGLALAVVTAALIIDYVWCGSRYFARFGTALVWPVIVLTAVGSVALSLLYSDYFGFIPCSLCWLQRIALYPQALMALMALRAKEAVFFPLYSIGLSIFGFIVAVYHYWYQMQPKELLSSGALPCLADGSADCASKVIDMFGFVTFPLLSAITFAFLIVLYLNLRRFARAA